MSVKICPFFEKPYIFWKRRLRASSYDKNSISIFLRKIDSSEGGPLLGSPPRFVFLFSSLCCVISFLSSMQGWPDWGVVGVVTTPQYYENFFFTWPKPQEKIVIMSYSTKLPLTTPQQPPKVSIVGPALLETDLTSRTWPFCFTNSNVSHSI